MVNYFFKKAQEKIALTEFNCVTLIYLSYFSAEFFGAQANNSRSVRENRKTNSYRQTLKSRATVEPAFIPPNARRHTEYLRMNIS
jgi:hypothetical protein